MFKRVTFDPNIMGGRACIRGMRIPVSAIVNQIAHGASFDDILAGYPDLEREDIQEAIEYAAWLAQERVENAQAVMRILVDMNVDVRVATQLHDYGHDAVHLRDEGLHRIPNGEIFSKAVAENRVVLTSDLDFGEIATALRDKPGKVILLRLHNSRAANVINRLKSVLPRVEADLAAGAIVIVEEPRHRVRPLPIGRTSDPS